MIFQFRHLDAAGPREGPLSMFQFLTSEGGGVHSI
jgi:hypothetical protein